MGFIVGLPEVRGSDSVHSCRPPLQIRSFYSMCELYKNGQFATLMCTLRLEAPCIPQKHH